ncbi:MAG: hypothetical protein GH155_01905 [Spirochaeta sp.]|nr:hypothetical protein [Spirochaeta sp.]
MKKFSLFIIIILVLITQLSWAQFYQELAPDQREELAEAYFLVGDEYLKVDKPGKGAEFKSMAYNINPRLQPEKIKEWSLSRAAALILSKEGFFIGEKPESLLRSKFKRLVGSFLAEDITSILEFVRGSLYISKLQAEATRQEITGALTDFFAAVSLKGLAPSQLYDFNSITFNWDQPDRAARWGETCLLTVQSRGDFSDYTSLWESEQGFLFSKIGGKWHIISIGKKMPPVSWKPQAVTSRVITPDESSDQGRVQVKTAFIECVSFFLDKDIRSATEYLHDQIKILRLNTTLSKKEMISTFQGYYENSDFTGVDLQDVLNQESIFVESSELFSSEIPGQVYLLTVKTRLDLSDKIPFWTRFQEYFFTQEPVKGGGWKIFAIF